MSDVRGQRTGRRYPLARLAIAGVLLIAAAVIALRRANAPITAAASSPVRMHPQLTIHAAAADSRLSAPIVVKSDSVRATPAEPSIDQIHDALRRLRGLDTTDGGGRDHIHHLLATLLTNDNVAEVARSLSTVELRTDFGTTVLLRWFDVDAPSAAAWWHEHQELRAEQAWQLGASVGPDATRAALALSAVAGMPLQEAFLRGAVASTADSDPAKAVRFADEFADPQERSDALQTVAYAWATSDPITAERFVATVGDPALRESLFATVSKAIADTDPDLAASWLTTVAMHQDMPRDAAVAVAGLWSERDPVAAAQWVQTLAPGDARLKAIETTFTHWLRADVTAALRWAQQLPEQRKILTDYAEATVERQTPKDDTW